jgi:hypothetical protein
LFQIVDFSSVNDLKFTYVHLQFQKFFRGYTPDSHFKVEGRGEEGKGGDGREGGEGRGGEGRGGEGRGGERMG